MKDSKKQLAFVAAGLVILYLAYRAHNNTYGQTIGQPAFVEGETPAYSISSQYNFQTPYYQNTPGIADNNFIMFGGGGPFVSAIDVNVSTDPLASLSQKYIPLFGLAGITAIRGG